MIRPLLSVVVLLAVIPQTTNAATVDGKVDATDGYTSQFDVTWELADMGMMGAPPVGTGVFLSGGSLWTKIDASGNLFFAARVPTDFNDNGYGANADASWGGGGHTFNELLGSDFGTFEVFGTASSTDPILTFNLDYIAEYGNGTSYHSAGVLDKDKVHPAFGTITDKADGQEVETTDPLFSYVPQVETSLAHNLTLPGATAANTTDSPMSGTTLFDNWEFGLIWEVKIDKSLFIDNSTTFAKVLPTVGHASPSKTDADTLIEPKIDLVIPMVPEPASIAIFGCGSLALVGLRRRRRRSET